MKSIKKLPKGFEKFSNAFLKQTKDQVSLLAEEEWEKELIKSLKIRLKGIDASELSKKCFLKNRKYGKEEGWFCGRRARRFLMDTLEACKNNMHCFVQLEGKDRYGRYIGTIFQEPLKGKGSSRDINRLMVKEGWAFSYPKYSKKYIDDQAYAKRKKKGIWKSRCVFLEEFRREQKRKQKRGQGRNKIMKYENRRKAW